MAAKASTFSSAMPRAMKPRPVRVQARKVRSEARRSRAREPGVVVLVVDGRVWGGGGGAYRCF